VTSLPSERITLTVTRRERFTLELISDLAQDDPDVWWSGAAMTL